MQVIIIIILVVLAIFLIFNVVRSYLTFHRILKEFCSGNVIVSARKGYGKDVLFNLIIDKRKEPYYANINYGGAFNLVSMKDLLLDGNTYHNFINGDVELVKKNDNFEKHDIYFSDGGVIVPSQCDSYLHKIYPSLPITYALSRHLYSNNIHINTQRIERVWKSLREQADYFVLLRKKPLKLPLFMVLFTTEYTRYESAKQELAPLGSRLFNKYSKAEKDKFNALHGFVKNGIIIVPKWKLHYDTRAFHKVLFGDEAPRKEKHLWLTKLKSFWLKIVRHFKRS